MIYLCVKKLIFQLNCTTTSGLPIGQLLLNNGSVAIQKSQDTLVEVD